MKTTAYITKEPCPAVLEELGYLSDRSHVTVVATDEAYIDFYRQKGYNTITGADLLSTSMNFTATIGNPPYLKNMHLQFLLKGLQNSDYISIVHPSGWLSREGNSLVKEVKAELRGRVSKIELFNGNAKFPNARFGCPLVITTAVKEHTGPIEVVYGTSGNTYHIDSLDDMPTGFWEPTEANWSLVDKFKALTETSSIWDILGKYAGSGSSISTPRVCGNQVKDAEQFVSYDFHTFFYRNSKIHNIDVKNKVFKTNSEAERDSLISYLKTKVARFGLAICKVSQDVHISRYLNNVPLPPVDRIWTEESIMEYYEFTESECALINQLIPDYYV